MKIPRGLSGKDLAALLCREWGYRIIHQQGSYIVAVARHKGLERQDLLRSL